MLKSYIFHVSNYYLTLIINDKHLIKKILITFMNYFLFSISTGNSECGVIQTNTHTLLNTDHLQTNDPDLVIQKTFMEHGLVNDYCKTNHKVFEYLN